MSTYSLNSHVWTSEAYSCCTCCSFIKQFMHAQLHLTQSTHDLYAMAAHAVCRTRGSKLELPSPVITRNNPLPLRNHHFSHKPLVKSLSTRQCLHKHLNLPLWHTSTQTHMPSKPTSLASPNFLRTTAPLSQAASLNCRPLQEPAHVLHNLGKNLTAPPTCTQPSKPSSTVTRCCPTAASRTALSSPAI